MQFIVCLLIFWLIRSLADRKLAALSFAIPCRFYYPFMNALHCLENLYDVILPSASRIKSEIARSRVNQLDQLNRNIRECDTTKKKIIKKLTAGFITRRLLHE